MFFFNNKSLGYSINKVQSKTCKINKILLFCFVDKIYIINNGYDWLFWWSHWCIFYAVIIRTGKDTTDLIVFYSKMLRCPYSY